MHSVRLQPCGKWRIALTWKDTAGREDGREAGGSEDGRERERKGSQGASDGGREGVRSPQSLTLACKEIGPELE